MAHLNPVDAACEHAGVVCLCVPSMPSVLWGGSSLNKALEEPLVRFAGALNIKQSQRWCRSRPRSVALHLKLSLRYLTLFGGF